MEPKAMEVELPEQLLAMTAQLAEPEAAAKAKAREGHTVAAAARASGCRLYVMRACVS